MTKYLLGLISLWLMCSCSDTDPGETPPIDPPTPTPTVTITKPEFVFGFQGQSKYSYCPSALKQADGTVHLYFCGNPENLIMVDNIFHIKINPDGTQTAAKSVLQPGVPGSWLNIEPGTIAEEKNLFIYSPDVSSLLTAGGFSGSKLGELTRQSISPVS